jgi:predicted phage tail protein
MLTKVRLDGVMGKKFGKEWELDVSSPAEALRMIEANSPGLKRWVLDNREKYDAYKVICVYEDGREEALDNDTYVASRTNLKSIRFTPTVAGASGIVKVIVGAVLIVASFYVTAAGFPTLGKAMLQIGATLALSGVIEILSPRPTKLDGNADAKSFYFDGAVNTEMQGNPIPLIYGRMLVGSHPISASISVDEIAP